MCMVGGDFDLCVDFDYFAPVKEGSSLILWDECRFVDFRWDLIQLVPRITGIFEISLSGLWQLLRCESCFLSLMISLHDLFLVVFLKSEHKSFLNLTHKRTLIWFWMVCFFITMETTFVATHAYKGTWSVIIMCICVQVMRVDTCFENLRIEW